MDQQAKTYLLKTLGCKANLYDSQLLEAELQKGGWIPVHDHQEQDAALCIVNTCTVTDEADKQSRKLAAKLARAHPNAKIVMTGCGAEVDPEKLRASPGVSFVVSNRDKPKLVDLVLKATRESGGQILGVGHGYEEMLSRHPMDREWPAAELTFLAPPSETRGEAGRTRTFLKIQEGCNSFCTYCIIPYGRGPNRSLRIPEVLLQIRKLVSEGVREVVITGTNIGDYGTDWQSTPALDELFERILVETSLERLRVSSLDPTEVTDRIIALMKQEPRFCPHFHVSLQSPHSKVLRLMKRRYGWEEVQSCLKKIAQIPAPIGGVFVGMDIITGFPGETEEDFDWTVQALSTVPWSRLHVFPYSERTGTPATRLPGVVSMGERNRRAQVLRKLSFERLNHHHHQVLASSATTGTPLRAILTERRTKGPDGTRDWIAGYTPNYLRVFVKLGKELVARPSSNLTFSAIPEQVVGDPNTGDVVLLAKWHLSQCNEIGRNSADLTN